MNNYNNNCCCKNNENNECQNNCIAEILQVINVLQSNACPENCLNSCDRPPDFCSSLYFKLYSNPVKYWIFLCQSFCIFVLCTSTHVWYNIIIR